VIFSKDAVSVSVESCDAVVESVVPTETESTNAPGDVRLELVLDALIVRVLDTTDVAPAIDDIVPAASSITTIRNLLNVLIRIFTYSVESTTLFPLQPAGRKTIVCASRRD
jgi:hypothetical protein